MAGDGGIASHRTQPYGTEGERFTYSVFLVLNNRTISTIVAFVVLRLKSLPTTPVRPTALESLADPPPPPVRHRRAVTSPLFLRFPMARGHDDGGVPRAWVQYSN